jgi:hypothetical protein
MHIVGCYSFVSDPDSIRSLRIRIRDPDPGGKKLPTKIEKIEKFLFEVLNDLFLQLKTSSVL